jgi:calcium-dependent protein kinase
MDSDGSGEISLEALERVLISSAGTGSLGALSTEEIHDIFHAMSVSKNQKTKKSIHWHEFLAATLSQSQVDHRNLRLAFERLDSDHKGVSSKFDI